MRRETFGVNVLAALNLIGTLSKYLSLAFIYPTAIAVGYGESPWPFILSAGITAASGSALERATRNRGHVGMREAYLVVGIVWVLLALFGSLPYLFSGEPQLSRPVDAYFEAMSGFTTTGASVLTDIEGLSHSLAMWRQFTQWLGGMGVIVLFLGVLPRLRVAGRQLFQVEAPGPEIGFGSTVRIAARRFLLVYVLLTAAEVAVLATIGWARLDTRMTFYEAVAHAFTTIPTGGFSTQARSMEEFGSATQWTVAAFMALAGTNFVLLYAGLFRRRARSSLKDEEFRVYLILLAAASAILTFEIASEHLAEGESAVRHAVFNTVSIMTTTGFASTDFNEWTPLTAMMIVGLMFVSASAGSTSGSIKLIRHIVIGKLIRREIDQTVHPELVAPIRLNRQVLDERTLRSIIIFAFLYVGIAAAGSVALQLDAARHDLFLTPFQSIAASATTLGGVGPGFGFAGPMGSFDPFSDFSKGVMIALMWFGRLEIIPIIVLLTKNYWRA